MTKYFILFIIILVSIYSVIAHYTYFDLGGNTENFVLLNLMVLTFFVAWIDSKLQKRKFQKCLAQQNSEQKGGKNKHWTLRAYAFIVECFFFL